MDNTAVSVFSLLFQIVFFALGVVVLAGGVAALRGRLPGNSWFGVRTPETKASPEAWELSNRAAGPGFLAAGAALMLGGFGILLVGGWPSVVIAVLAALVAVGMLSFAGLAGARAAAIWFENARVTGTLPEGLGAPTVSDSCCSAGGSDSAPASGAGSSADPAAAAAASDCGVSGGCGSCTLKGMCTSEGAAHH
ncbi:SdpI family protein [Dietzia sp.]|uniref:SdpI family protein n=1 Tax=Dietzia sp. TaxID=1871616 RepID=UPI002FDA3445